MILLNFSYWIISTVELLLMKILANNYVDDIIFNSFTRSIMLPYNTWKIYKMYKLKKKFNPRWFDILTGILDQLDIYFCYIALSGISIGEYITYRTFSIFITGVSLYMFGKNMLSIKKIMSLILIFCACLILLIFNNDNNGKIKYIFACLFSSYMYSCIGILIELNVKTKSDRKINYYWTKIISNIIGAIVAIMFENQTQSLSNILTSTNSLYIILIISLLIAICENFNYYLKVKIIALTQNDNNGSIIIIFLDIFRRFTLLIIGGIFFHEYYNNIMYFSISLMFLGSIIGLMNFSQCIDKNSLSNSNTGNTENTKTTIVEKYDNVIDDDNIELIKDPIDNI
jgi:drug/metabolite transporter (DMT)-like permease